MQKAKDMKRLIEMRVNIDHHTKSILEKAALAAGRPQQPMIGILLQRVLRLYEKNPAALVKLGIIAQSEHPELAAQLETAVA